MLRSKNLTLVRIRKSVRNPMRRGRSRWPHAVNLSNHSSCSKNAEFWFISRLSRNGRPWLVFVKRIDYMRSNKSTAPMTIQQPKELLLNDSERALHIRATFAADICFEAASWRVAWTTILDETRICVSNRGSSMTPHSCRHPSVVEIL